MRKLTYRRKEAALSTISTPTWMTTNDKPQPCPIKYKAWSVKRLIWSNRLKKDLKRETVPISFWLKK